MISRPISENTIRRLPRYLKCLKELQGKAVERVSSSGLGKSLDQTSSQVRQDLSQFGLFGTQGFGYDIQTLVVSIQEIIGIGEKTPAILVGAENLGIALMCSFDFEACGFKLLAAFDVASKKQSEIKMSQC